MLLFADDIALLSHSKNDMDKLLETCASFAKRWRFKFGLDKCKVLVVGDQKTYQLDNEQPIDQASEYEYLGITVTDDFSTQKFYQNLEKKVKNKKGAALSWLNNTNPNNFQLCPEIKITNIYEKIIRPGSEYGAQIFGANEGSETLEKLHTTHLKRSLLGNGTHPVKASTVRMVT